MLIKGITSEGAEIWINKDHIIALEESDFNPDMWVVHMVKSQSSINNSIYIPKEKIKSLLMMDLTALNDIDAFIKAGKHITYKVEHENIYQ